MGRRGRPRISEEPTDVVAIRISRSMARDLDLLVDFFRSLFHLFPDHFPKITNRSELLRYWISASKQSLDSWIQSSHLHELLGDQIKMQQLGDLLERMRKSLQKSERE